MVPTFKVRVLVGQQKYPYNHLILRVFLFQKENLNRSSIKIFPNPARESFSLKLNNIDKVSVKIYNYLGKLVFDKKNIVDNSEININGFSKGIYLVKVIDNNQDTYLSKLIVE